MKGDIRSQFLLDPGVVFLNHGSFGACPRPVLETYHYWQRDLERQPVEFLSRRLDTLLATARAALAEYVHAAPEDLIFMPNATMAINAVARSLNLGPGDEILTTDHEYGAIDFTWQFVAQQTGARIVTHPVQLPVTTHADFVEDFWRSVTPQTKVISISHITSPTALIFPVVEICRRARKAGIFTLVDGAHAPGQLPLDLTAIDADAYTGNCHKWLCTPKGSAFLYVRQAHQAAINPLVISWGWGFGETFVQRHQWMGTSDVAAYLSIPAAIRFQADHNWDAARERCHQLARRARLSLSQVTAIAPIQPDSPDWFAQMVAVPLPDCDADRLKARLYDEDRIEIPATRQGDRRYLRVSCQAYNHSGDISRLVSAVAALLPSDLR